MDLTHNMAEFRCSKYVSGSCATSSPGSVGHGLGVSCLLFPGVSGLYFHSSKVERASFAVNSPKSSVIYAVWVNLIPSFILEPITVAKLVVLTLISLSQCHMIIPRIWGGVRSTQTMSTRRRVGVVSPGNTGLYDKKGEEEGEVYGKEK